MGMWKVHLTNLLKESWHIALAKGSSTGISVFWIALGAIIIGFVVSTFIEWTRGGRTMTSLKHAVKSWPPYAGAVVALILVWGGLYIWEIGATIYKDHESLVIANSTLRDENKILRIPKVCPQLTPKSTVLPTRQPLIAFTSKQSFVNNEGGTIGPVTVTESSINGAPAPDSSTGLVHNKGKIGEIHLNNVHICNLTSWDSFLDCIESDSGDKPGIESIVNSFKSQIESELNKQPAAFNSQVIACRKSMIEVEKTILENSNDEHQIVRSLRRNSPICIKKN